MKLRGEKSKGFNICMWKHLEYVSNMILSLLFLTDKLHIAQQVTPTPPSLPRKRGARTCALAVGRLCMQRRRLSEEAM